MQKRHQIKTDGIFFLSFLKAGESLKLLLDIDNGTIDRYKAGVWYDIEEFIRLLSSINHYQHHEVILERIGEEMMQSWYYNGPGRQLISSGVDFIRFQSGSAGYQSVVQGSKEYIGEFQLLMLDENKGIAKIHTTTPFPNALERGVLYGGIGLIGDVLYYDILSSNEKDHFEIRFVTSENRLSIPWRDGVVLEENEWKLQHINNKFSRRENYLSCINNTLNTAYTEMKTRATIDYLTGINNRREFFRLAEAEFEKVVRHDEPMSVLYFDLDNFKQINDMYGHDAGDAVLIAFAKMCMNNCRKYDILGRLGGEEFAFVLPRVNIKEAILIAEKILEKTRELSIPLIKGCIKFTTSIGIAEFNADKSLDSLLKRADEQLFLAKERGRNQVAFAN